jgi:hypothetical protein
MTQIDPTVLAELPEDVRLELQHALPASRHVFTVRGNLNTPPDPPANSECGTSRHDNGHASPFGPADLDFPKNEARCLASEPEEDPRQVWASVQTALENLNDELERQHRAPSTSRSTGAGHSGGKPSSAPPQSMESDAGSSEDDLDSCPQPLGSQHSRHAMGETGHASVAEVETSVSNESKHVDDKGCATDGSEWEGSPEVRLGALCKLLQEWAGGRVNKDLEGLHFVLRRLTGVMQNWPMLAPQLDGCVAAVQGAVEEYYGAPLKVS